MENSPDDLHITRSLGALRAPTSSWRPFGPLDFVLRSLWVLRPCGVNQAPMGEHLTHNESRYLCLTMEIQVLGISGPLS